MTNATASITGIHLRMSNKKIPKCKQPSGSANYKLHVRKRLFHLHSLKTSRAPRVLDDITALLLCSVLAHELNTLLLETLDAGMRNIPIAGLLKLGNLVVISSFDVASFRLLYMLC